MLRLRWIIRSILWIVPALFVSCGLVLAGEDPLTISVYATAGDVSRYLASAQNRQDVEKTLKSHRVTRIFLEGRRGDEYVPPEALRELREDMQARGFEVAGGIATVPGSRFGIRQNGALGWLNWEAQQTQREVADFFRQNARVFDELIVDDFYCTADTTPDSEKARGTRSWAQYRQDLLVSLIEPMMLRPALEARSSVRLVLKFPQWYDRFHLFGYDPVRMATAFDRIWVGTETRNPDTRRMGFVEPYEGFVNFRWLRAAIGEKVRGAWFDHIDCTARNFVDQAYQSVLAGAQELTFFHLGDLIEGHPGHPLLKAALPELTELAGKIRRRSGRGIAFYKPPGGDTDENLYLADYLGMIGLPIVPEAHYPSSSKVAILAVQAAGDPHLLDMVGKHLKQGATIIMTPALLRQLGPAAQELAGVRISTRAETGKTNELEISGPATTARRAPLSVPLEIELGLEASPGRIHITASAGGRRVPWLTSRAPAGGRLLVWNVRTFSEQDFRDAGEWLLAPKKHGLPDLPQEAADALRDFLLSPLGIRFSARPRIGFYLFSNAHCFYNFLDRPVEVRVNGKAVKLEPNSLLWQ